MPAPAALAEIVGKVFFTEGTRFRWSVLSLILSNMVPLYGALFLGWHAGSLMVLFWLENVVIGGYNVLKMLCARKPGGAGKTLEMLFIIPFFIVHYGGFCFGHGLFVVGLFAGTEDALKAMDGFNYLPVLERLFREHPGLLFALATVIVSHGVSFFTNYLGRHEYKQNSVQDLMNAPYGRVILLHVTILLGGMLVMMTGALVGLVLLVLLKTTVDLIAHLREHQKQAEVLPELPVVSESALVQGKIVGKMRCKKRRR